MAIYTINTFTKYRPYICTFMKFTYDDGVNTDIFEIYDKNLAGDATVVLEPVKQNQKVIAYKSICTFTLLYYQWEAIELLQNQDVTFTFAKYRLQAGQTTSLQGQYSEIVHSDKAITHIEHKIEKPSTQGMTFQITTIEPEYSKLIQLLSDVGW